MILYEKNLTWEEILNRVRIKRDNLLGDLISKKSNNNQYVFLFSN